MLTKELVERVLTRDVAAVRAFVNEVGRIFQREAGFILWRWRRHAAGRSLRQEQEDLVQELFAALFGEEARALRAWDAAKGRSLPVFLAVFARNQIISILRSGRRTPWRDLPTEAQSLATLLTVDPDLPEQLAEQEGMRRLLQLIESELNHGELELFHRLFWEFQSLEQICEETGLTPQVLYKRKSRLKEKIRELQAKVRAERES